MTNLSQVYTWGSGDCSRLGYQPPLRQQLFPKHVSLETKIKKVALGMFHALALDFEGRLYSWGSGASGQLGHNKLQNDVKHTFIQKEPQIIVDIASQNIQDIAVGAKHNLALSDKGSLFTWGCNKKGQLGLGDVKGALKPKIPMNVIEK